MELAAPRKDESEKELVLFNRDPSSLLFARLFVGGMLSLAPAVFLQFKAVGAPGFFLDAIIPFSAGGAFEPDVFPHQLAPSTSRKAP